MSAQVAQQSRIHPFGNHTELKQLGRSTFGVPDIFMSYSLRDDDLVAIPLEKGFSSKG